MAKISEIMKKNEGISKEDLENIQKCFFCGSKISKGGCWSGKTETMAVCRECIDQLADLLIDSVSDTIDFDKVEPSEQLKYILNSVENRFIYKKTK